VCQPDLLAPQRRLTRTDQWPRPPRRRGVLGFLRRFWTGAEAHFQFKRSFSASQNAINRAHNGAVFWADRSKFRRFRPPIFDLREPYFVGSHERRRHVRDCSQGPNCLQFIERRVSNSHRSDWAEVDEVGKVSKVRPARIEDGAGWGVRQDKSTGA
jgi:hypothetical protein